MKSNNDVIKQIVQTCIQAIPSELHLRILREMFGFDGILNFSQTIKELIALDQMPVFGISKEMQIILRHVNQLKMLSHMSSIRKLFQREYEKLHNKTVVVVQMGGVANDSLDGILVDIAKKFDETCDIIYQQSSISGVSVRYGDSIVEYTSQTVGGVLKAA
jgi:F0F1-type ATP synthase delta subunit